MRLLIALATLFVLTGQTIFGATPAKIRISAWYWLNSAPRQEWPRDFRKMADLGFTDVAICWGLDAAAWQFRVEDTRFALKAARAAGVGVYIIVWHPTHNSLPRRAEYQQVDVLGRLRWTFNTFNPDWRNTQWREYLQKVAGLYGADPAFAGYMFDDSFFPGALEKFGGEYGPIEQRYVSYSGGDKTRYGKEPPKTKSDPDWKEWCDTRAKWWREWAADTVRFIREADPNSSHEVYVEDGVTILRDIAHDLSGVDLHEVSQPLDAIGVYTSRGWDGSPQATSSGAEHTLDILRQTRAAVGPGKQLIYTFWVANSLELRKPEPAKYPTFEQIKTICDAALSFGIRHLDMYGFRIGNSVVTPENWPSLRPSRTGPYKLTGQFVRKHLYDRPEIHDQLGKYLRGLNGRK